ncbi:MAG TPA: NAD-dependent protein deacylase [Gammaproteobacteria bacterium]
MTAESRDASLPPGLGQALADAQRWAVMTGSGISAESGVPTFRDAQVGLWEQYDAEELATPEAFVSNPQLVWDWYVWRRELVAAADPNAGHRALARLATLKPGLALITQNVDGLHQRAGNEDVIEFHGRIDRDRCFSCKQVPKTIIGSDQRPPPCPCCGGPLRPDVVWFGEAISHIVLERALEAATGCDLFLSVGTSSLVYPAAGLAEAAAARGATIVEINTNPTPLTPRADFPLQGLATFWLPAIVAGVERAG